MFKNTILFALLITAVYGSAFANIPSTAYVEDYVATEIGKLPAQPVVNNATLTIQKNGTSVGTFTANQSTNKTINITVPTGALASKNAVTTSEITDGTIATADIADSAITTAKIAAGAVTSAKIADATITNDDIAKNAAIEASKISGLARVATSGSYDDLSNKPSIPSAYTLPPATTTGLGGVKIGGNIDVTNDGTVSVKPGTPSALGVVKVGQIPSGSAESTTYATIWVE